MNDIATSRSVRPRLLGLPVLALAALALLAVPRPILHDLHLIQPETFLNMVLVVLPVVVWIGVAVASGVRYPFLTVLVIGGFSGVYLAIVHQAFWSANLGGTPALGGNLAGRFDPVVEELLLRGAATVSSLFTGIAIGAIAGLLAWGLSAVVRRSAR